MLFRYLRFSREMFRWVPNKLFYESKSRLVKRIWLTSLIV